MLAPTNPSEDGEALAEIVQPLIHDVSPSSVLHCDNGLPPPKWYAIYTNPRHEKRVAQHLEIRDVEHFLPTYCIHRKWADGSKVTLNLPLFPGYLFVRINRSQRGHVLGIPGIIAIVCGTGNEPSPLNDSEIEALRLGLNASRVIEPHALLTVGCRARVNSGAFAGMEGVIVRKKSGGIRIVLTLNLIMRSIAVEVGASELDLLDPLPHLPISVTFPTISL